MNDVYVSGEIYSIGDNMCYNNKVMMNTSRDEVITVDSRSRGATNICRSRLLPRRLFDLLIAVVVLTLIALIEFGVIPSGRLGFVCKDASISHPFNGDTVTVTILVSTILFGPMIVIYITEVFQENSFKRVCLRNMWFYYKQMLIYLTLVLLITEVMKVLVGEPRPHFLASCLPDVADTCVEGTLVLNYSCTNQDISSYNRVDSDRSFPSGHSSCTIFVALYCSYIIQQRIPVDTITFLIKPLLIGVCLTWSSVCSLTRITDRRHHWWDVLVGGFIGLFGALYAMYVVRNLERKVGLSRSSTTTTVLSEIKNKEHRSDV